MEVLRDQEFWEEYHEKVDRRAKDARWRDTLLLLIQLGVLVIMLIYLP